MAVHDPLQLSLIILDSLTSLVVKLGGEIYDLLEHIFPKLQLLLLDFGIDSYKPFDKVIINTLINFFLELLKVTQVNQLVYINKLHSFGSYWGFFILQGAPLGH